MIWIKKDEDGSIYNFVKNGIRGEDSFTNDLTLGIYFDTILIAGITFSFYGKHNVYLSIYSEDVRWCSRRVINFIYNYCFNVLCFKKITCIAAKRNRKIRKFLVRLGFRLEGVIRYGRLNGNPAFFYGLQYDDKARNKFKRKEE